jgi:hypothetical protein
MHEEGTLSIVRTPSYYQVRYASNNYGTLDRQPYRCPDEVHLAACLYACGLDFWSIQQACAELREGRMAIMPLVGARAQLDATFPLAPTSHASAVSHPYRMTTRQAIRALFFPQEKR